ncbi:MAG: HD-GYP domain-containing protein [Actinobacteria bacterium]|nr:HD-GYP domain-containing protein [Actinomycetota bacterium]
MSQESANAEISRIEDFGLVSDDSLMRRIGLGLILLGGTIEIVYSLAFRAPDWTDAAAIGLLLVAAGTTLVMPLDRVSPRWIILPLMFGLASVSLIAMGDEVDVGMGFMFLPAAVMMIFFWHDAPAKWFVMAVVAALYVAVPAVWGGDEAIVESLTTLPMLVAASALLGMLFHRFRRSTVEQARFRGTITALLMALDARDDHSIEHSSDVLGVVSSVAEDLGLDSREQLHVADVALLHDIGKIGIPNEILTKPSSLTDEEWDVMRRHPVIGERILNEVPGFEKVATAVRHEHERWDGKGYPDGLRAEAIPLASRIVLACDAYDAMISKRPYREPLTETEAREQLLRNSGTQFDPRVVNSLLKTLERRGIERIRNGGTGTAVTSIDPEERSEAESLRGFRGVGEEPSVGHPKRLISSIVSKVASF